MENRVAIVGTKSLDVASALCALCQTPVSGHVTEEGFRCPDAPMKHPLRRESDGNVVFVPLRNVVALNDSPADVTETETKTARRVKRTKPRKSRQSRVKEAREPKGRGRHPGLYMVTSKADPAKLKMTESIDKVFRVIKKSNGITQNDIASKLEMPTGTVGWALGKLAKQRAVARQAAVAS
jgi:hypothetical protein